MTDDDYDTARAKAMLAALIGRLHIVRRSIVRGVVKNSIPDGVSMPALCGVYIEEKDRAKGSTTSDDGVCEGCLAVLYAGRS